MHFSQKHYIHTYRPTDGPTDGRTDTPSYRDARTHLKKFLSDLFGELLGFQFLHLGDASLRLAAQKAATPMTANLLRTIVEVVLDGFDDFAEGALVLGVSVGQTHGGASLTTDHTTQPSLTLDDAVGNIHFPAKRREMHDEFDGVDVVRDDHQLRLLLLHLGGHRVETGPDDGGSL